MKRRAMMLLAGAVLGTTSLFAAEAKPTPEIEIAICLDTSGSMDGLIESAKQKLWAVVTDLGTANPAPKLRVALYQYGNDGLQSEMGWVQQLCPLTDDLDSVYGKLFALKTNGGTELVARAVKMSAEQLGWSGEPQTLRMIVVAGNEPATQDADVTLETACKLAAGKGIVVNTIFCGSEQEGRSTGWADAAKLADGRYSAIDANGGTVVIDSPFDKEIAELGTKLNSTYVAYGPAGAVGQQNQVAQDFNAVAVGAPAAALRAAGKATTMYSNAGWDLVDAVKEKQVELAAMPAAQLPEPMQAIPAEQRAQFIEQKSRERVEIQAQISELNAKREQHIQKEMEKRGLDEKGAFDAALKQAIRDQAAQKGIELK